EIEPLGASDIAVEHFAHMQADIHVGGRKFFACPAGAERLHLLARFHGCGKRSGTGMRTIFRRKDCKNAVTDQLEHVSTLRVDRRDHDGMICSGEVSVILVRPRRSLNQMAASIRSVTPRKMRPLSTRRPASRPR